MAKKVILKDQNNIEILPISRGELILDSSGKQAFHSNEFLATDSQPGLMSKEDKAKLDKLNENGATIDLVSATADGLAPKIGTVAASTVTTQADEWVLTSTKGATPTWRKLPTNAFLNYYRPILVNGTSLLGNDNTALNIVAGTNINLTTDSGKVTINNAGVRSVTIGTGENNKKLAVDTNGTITNLTIPFATESSYLYGHITQSVKQYQDVSLKWYVNILKTSDHYAGDNTGFPANDNSNGILWLGTHSQGPYGGQLGVSSNSRLYYRYITAGSFPTTANGGSWNKIAWTSEIPTKLSQLTNDSGYLTNSSLSNYVTLNTDQTITGWKIFSNNVELTPYNDHGTYSLVFRTKNNGTKYLSCINGDLKFGNSDDMKKVWHEGNDGHNSGLDADTLDGQHLDYILKNTKRFYLSGKNDGNYRNANLTTEGIITNYNDPADWKNAPTDMYYGQIINFSGYNYDGLLSQMAWDTKQRVWYRCNNGEVWKEWKEFAFTDSNVESANKLSKIVTLWGQNFDGSSNVSGTLSNVNNIYGSDTEAFYLYQSGAPTNAGNLGVAVGVGCAPNSYGIFLWGTGDGKGHIQVGRKDNSSTAYDVILQEFGGKVGIGTKNPAYALDVNGTIRANGNILLEPANNGGGNVNGGGIAFWNGSGYVNGTINASTLILNNGSTSGNVGIGVITPTQKLEVNGNVKAGSFIGNLDWSYITNKPTSFTPEAHTHSYITMGTRINASEKATSYTKGALSMQPVYNNGYPEYYGNTLTLNGDGTGQMFVSWNAAYTDSDPNLNSLATELYLRSRRDNQTLWTGWTRVLTNHNYGTYVAPKTHTHTSDQITALTGYTKATSAADLMVTDTLNTALGKLEYKAGIAYSWYRTITEDDTDEIINKWDEVVDFVNNLEVDLTEEFVTRKTAQTITGQKTFTTTIKFGRDMYRGTVADCAMDLNNSDIKGINSLYFMDAAQDCSEGINFVSTTTDCYDTISAYNGVLYFYPNRPATTLTYTNARIVLHSGNTYINNGTITINGSSITPLTSHQSLANYVTLNTDQTITGLKTFVGETQSLSVKRTGSVSNEPCIMYFDNSTKLGAMGLKTGIGPFWWDTSTVFHILHSGTSHIKNGVITINGTSITPITSRGYIGTTEIQATSQLQALSGISSIFLNTGDATLKFYSGRTQDGYNDGNICLQTCIDGNDGETHSYASAPYQSRENIVLQPRAGQVLIGYLPTTYTPTDYKLIVNGNIAIGGTSTAIAPAVHTQTSMLQIIAGSGGATNSSAIGFHNPGISSAALEYRNSSSQIGSFNFLSDDTTWGVGIGTTTPAYKLDVVGISRITNNGNEKLILNTVDTANYNLILFQKDGVSTGYIGTRNQQFDIRFNDYPNFYYNGYKVWHENNDGSGSGLDADLLDGYHETDFFRYRGDIDISYINIDVYTAGDSRFKKINPGTYNIPRTSYSEMLISFAKNTGSTSSLELKTSYNNYDRLYIRKVIDSNRVSGSWKALAYLDDITTELSKYYWANIKISGTSVTDATPTFGLTTATCYVATQQMSLKSSGLSNDLTVANRGGLFSNGIIFTNSGTPNDVGFIRLLGNSENNTVLEIGTGDDGAGTTSESIVARLYSAGAVAKEAWLLDTVGNTQLPGKLILGRVTRDFTSYPETSTYRMGIDVGDIHFVGAAAHKGNSITWAYGSTSAADAGIYVKHHDTYGSKMYFATTGSWANGPMAAMEIDHTGQVNIVRSNLKVSTGNILISHSASANMSTSSSNPQIVFSENGSQPVQLMYTDYDDYRSPAGLKVLGSQGSEWFEVVGKIYGAGFVKSGSSDSYALLGGGGHKAVSDFLLKSEIASQELSANLTTITKSLTVTADWMDTGIAYNNLPSNGTYVVQVFVAANNSTDSMWECYWSGVMSWFVTGNSCNKTNDSETDEIILHRSGHAYANTIYLRTVMTSAGSDQGLKLQIAANKNLGAAYTYTFKFKRII